MMIYASGVVSFLTDGKKSPGKFDFKNDVILLEVIGKNSGDCDGSAIKVICKFNALIPRSFECKSLEDYTGKIKPFLQKFIQSTVLSVEIHHLNYSRRTTLDSSASNLSRY